jgi:diguanylate cyclase (GGDEF)-like protein
MPEPNLIDSYIHALAPGSVLSVGAAVALMTAGMMAFQAYKNRTDRIALAVATLSLFFGAASFFLTAPIFSQPVPAPKTLFSVMLGTASMFCGMYSFILLFKPKFSPLAIVTCGLTCLSGYAVWSSGQAMGHWFFACQLIIALLTSIMLANSKETLAPQMRLVALGMCVFVAIGALPRLFWITTLILDPSLAKPQSASTEYRFGALVWVLLPVLLYAIVTGVVQARISKRLKTSSDLDLLTGAFSRRYLFEVGERIVEQRDTHSLNVKVLLIDVDHFKSVNDTWGHAVGDAVLKHCVQTIKEVTRLTDSIVSRYGGEEFCVLLTHQNFADASRIAERIRQRIADVPFIHEQQSIALTVSIGISGELDGREGTSLSALIAVADKKLYQAKRTGRNRVIHSLDGLIPA